MITRGEKHLCEYEYGISGGFMTLLFKAMSSADFENRAKLALGYPEEVEALTRFKNEDGYWEDLQERYREVRG